MDIPEFSECSYYIKGTDCGPDDGILMSVLVGDIQEAAEKGASDCCNRQRSVPALWAAPDRRAGRSPRQDA